MAEKKNTPKPRRRVFAYFRQDQRGSYVGIGTDWSLDTEIRGDAQLSFTSVDDAHKATDESNLRSIVEKLLGKSKDFGVESIEAGSHVMRINVRPDADSQAIIDAVVGVLGVKYDVIRVDENNKPLHKKLDGASDSTLGETDAVKSAPI